MRNYWISFAFAALLLASACGGEKTASTDTQPVDEKQVLLDSIAKLEQVLLGTKDINNARQDAFAMISVYKLYADKYPQDELVPEYLFKGAEVATGLKQYTQAIVLYKRIYEDFKSYDKHSMALFLIGFTYDSHLKDYDQARTWYEKCIEEFPGTRVAEDAQGSLDIMGLSDEELIKKFEEKNAS